MKHRPTKENTMSKADDQRNLDQAKRALDNYKATDDNDPKYLQLNRAVNDAAKKVSWWKRG
jgi:hypothetical protein